LQGIHAKFGWRNDGPGSSVIPKPPDLTATFLQAVAAADFHLTDEHEDDNTQQGLLELMDACTVLQYHHREAVERSLESKKEKDGKKALELWLEAKDLADAYDETMDRAQQSISTALDDMERRLREASWLRQLHRPLGKLPPGHNPSTLPDPIASKK